jgi:hypothetical protein
MSSEQEQTRQKQPQSSQPSTQSIRPQVEETGTAAKRRITEAIVTHERETPTEKNRRTATDIIIPY